MGCILVWENNKWFYDRFTNRDYDGEQPREPLYKVGDIVIYRKQQVKIEWCSCTVTDQSEHIIWYDVRKDNNHSMICLETELTPDN